MTQHIRIVDISVNYAKLYQSKHTYALLGTLNDTTKFHLIPTSKLPLFNFLINHYAQWEIPLHHQNITKVGHLPG